ncbi:MAG: c-type cytochrome [Steroidobacteraceae bacterium]
MPLPWQRSRSAEVRRLSAPAFWIIKHGIKMSAMPAWGKSLDDAAIWDIVAFVRQLPQMTPDTSAQITGGSSRPP